MRLLITGGGTAGHVYPALAVVEAVLDGAAGDTRAEDIAWVGSAASIEERIVSQQGLAFHPVSTGPIVGKHPLTVGRSVLRLARGYREGHALLRAFRPAVVLATGGYVSVPLVLAASAAHCPSLIYLPDMTPGLAVKLLARVAQRVAVSFDSVTAYFPRDKVFVSGYPVRQALYQVDRPAARARLDLDPAWPMLLVMGGSRGAHSLNVAVHRALERLLAVAQVVHVSGFEDYPVLNAVREGLPTELRARYHLFAYMYETMTEAIVAADLVVARAGAATLGEFPAAGVPALVVPYPYSGQHQQLNAAYLAEHGAGVVVPDAELEARLVPAVTQLLGDPHRLQAMRSAARMLAKPDAARRIARELHALATAGGKG